MTKNEEALLELVLMSDCPDEINERRFRELREALLRERMPPELRDELAIYLRQLDESKQSQQATWRGLVGKYGMAAVNICTWDIRNKR